MYNAEPHSAIADARIAAVIARLQATRRTPAAGGPRGNPTMSRDPNDYAEQGFSIHPEQGELNLLCRGLRATRVAEFATSVGMSTLYFAAAIRDNGGGTVIGSEIVRDGGWRPNIEFPPPPQFTSGGQAINISRSIIIHDASNGEYPGKGILYTENFDASSPTWFTMNAGLIIEQARAVNKIVVTTNGAVYVAFEGEWNASSREGHFIARAPNVGGIFTVIHTEADVEAEYPGSYDNRYNIIALGCRNDTAETVIYLAGGHTGVDTSNIGVYLGSGGSFSKTMTLGNVRVGNDIAYSTYGQSTWGMVYKTVVGLGSPPGPRLRRK